MRTRCAGEDGRITLLVLGYFLVVAVLRGVAATGGMTGGSRLCRKSAASWSATASSGR